MTVLEDSGFEPARTDEGTVLLRNCPFDAVAREHTDLICGANVAFLEASWTGPRWRR